MQTISEETKMNTFTIETAVRRWGNSQAIRLSKEIMKKMNLKENDRISVSIDSGKMIIEKINKPKYRNLKERLEVFYNKPIEDIYVESTQEVDMGTPSGDEIW